MSKNFDPLNVHQTGPNEILGFFDEKINEEDWEAKTEQRLIYCTVSKMKEFHKHFLESLLEGVKAEGRSQMDRSKRCLFFI